MIENILLFNIDVSNLTKNDLLDYLKKDASSLGIQEIMSATSAIREDGKYIPVSYRDKYIKSYIDGFIKKIKEIKDDKTDYPNDLNINELKEALTFLKEQQENISLDEVVNPYFTKIYILTCIYTTFLTHEPIHVVGTPFPGGFEVTKKDNTYYCPVKEKQQNNSGAVCLLCIAEQDPSLDV